MFYVIKRLDLNATPVYLYTASRNNRAINVTRLDAATPFATMEAAVDAIIAQGKHYGSNSLGRLTIVGAEEVREPTYREVQL